MSTRKHAPTEYTVQEVGSDTQRLLDLPACKQGAQASRLDHLLLAAAALAGASAVESVFEAILRGVHSELPGIDRVALVILPSSYGREVVLSSESASIEHVRPEWISSTVCERVAASGRAVRTADARLSRELDSAMSIRLSGARAIAAVPLSDGNGVSGILYADSLVQLYEVASIDDIAVSYLVALANMAVHAVRRAQAQWELQVEMQRRLRLSRYHSPSILAKLLADASIEAGRSHFEEREVSVMFADVAGFTAMSERLSPTEVAGVLNLIFEALVDSLFSEGGTLDKYIGDCVMAFFGAPRADLDHANAAVRAARRMMRCFADLVLRQTIPSDVGLRIAIASGAAVVGDIGSRHRIEYTVMGATVNRAARIEGVLPSGAIGLDQQTVLALDDTRGIVQSTEIVLNGIGSVPLFLADW
jgi:adenylate cyclase